MSKPIAQSFVELVVDKVLEGAAKNARQGLENFKVILGVAFDKYLENAYDKYSTSKTLLYRFQARKIRDFYVIPTLQCGNSTITANSVRNIFELQKGKSQRYIITGTGGVGKSMLMKHLFVRELEDEDLIPIFFELRNLNNKKVGYDLRDAIFENMGIIGNTMTRKTIKRALERGMFLLLLDGYDEIKASLIHDFRRKLNNFCDKYPHCYIILSSRPLPLERNFISFEGFSILETTGLNKKQSVEMIKKLDYDYNAKQRFMTALDEKLFNEHESFASNPLLLTMMFLTYDTRLEIPDTLHVFYERAFETIFSLHDATKEGVYKREFETRLPQDSFKRVLACFCCLTYYHNKINFSKNELSRFIKKASEETGVSVDIDKYVNDLTTAVCMLYVEGFLYSFVHRSFQEYFTAAYLKDQVDECMEKRSLAIIQKKEQSVTSDYTFKMLQAMAPEKFEKNLLFPILKQFNESLIGISNNSEIERGVAHTYALVTTLTGELMRWPGSDKKIFQADVNMTMTLLAKEKDRLEKKYAPKTIIDDDFFEV